jgi:hypothetical protein
VLEGLEKGWSLREDPHDRRIFHAPAPLDGFIHIARKFLTPEQLAEAQKLVFFWRYSLQGEGRRRSRDSSATSVNIWKEGDILGAGAIDSGSSGRKLQLGERGRPAIVGRGRRGDWSSSGIGQIVDPSQPSQNHSRVSSGTNRSNQARIFKPDWSWPQFHQGS